MSASLRLDRFLSQATGLSRSLAQQAIRRGKVKVDGELVRDPSRHVTGTQPVFLEGVAVAISGPRYFMLNKPPGYVCSTRDDRNPTVLDLLRESRPESLHIAGRLDIDTTGLVLITDDGDWSHRVTAPRRKCSKVYRVQLAEPFNQQMAEQLVSGLLLKGETKPTAPAEVEVSGDREIRLTITEGRYHQVKRMLAAVGNHVVGLHRECIGSVGLDPVLAPGEYRALTEQEISALSHCG